MKVLLLAAGRSTRMKPVGDKNFLAFLGKPLIVWQIETLKKTGFSEIILVGGEHNLQKLQELKKEFDEVKDVVEQEDLTEGMAGAVLSAERAIGDQPFLLVSSNDVVDESAFNEIMKAYQERFAEVYLLGMKVEEYFPGGYLKVSDDGFVDGVVEKPGKGKEPSNLVNLVVHLHSDPAKLIEFLKDTSSENDDRYEAALDKMIRAGVKVKAVSYEGFWQPIKFPWHVHRVFQYLFEHADQRIDDSAEISESATVKGDVIIGKNVKIFEGAVVNGPVFIGDNCIIANNALVRDSHLGEGCVIGYSTEVARSFLGHDVWTHSNYIGDSVIGSDVSFGAGTVTGNLRLDEENICVEIKGNKLDCGRNKFGLVTGDNIRAGVNVSFMPGVKVGGGSFVGAGIVVAEDIDENSFVRAKTELKISENKSRVDISSREDLKNNL